MNRARAALIVSLTAVSVLSPFPANACTMMPFISWRLVKHAHFVGVAAPDTMFAGPGDVEYRIAEGHFGRAVQRRIYGQLVSVERMGGLAGRQLRGASRVLLVPWDYGADCTPTPWAGTAQWVAPGTRGFFIAALRDSARWTNGVPTFDVFAPQLHPYRQQDTRVMGRRVAADSMLDIDQVFALADLLPHHGLADDSAEVGVEPLFAWARSNPELAKRYPAEFVLSSIRRWVMQSRLRRIRSPLLGTYRFALTLNDGGERTYYARARPLPSSAFNLLEQSPGPDPTSIPKPDGYYLLLTSALSEDSLARDCERDRDHDKEGYLAVLDEPPTATPRGSEWRGVIALDLVTRLFRADSALHQFARAAYDRSYQRYVKKVPRETPARFIQSNGALRIEQDIVLDDGRTARIRGERVSNVTVACKW